MISGEQKTASTRNIIRGHRWVLVGRWASKRDGVVLGLALGVAKGRELHLLSSACNAIATGAYNTVKIHTHSISAERANRWFRTHGLSGTNGLQDIAAETRKRVNVSTLSLTSIRLVRHRINGVPQFPSNPLSRGTARSSVSFRLLSLHTADARVADDRWSIPTRSNPSAHLRRSWSRRDNMSWIFYGRWSPASSFIRGYIASGMLLVSSAVRCYGST